MSSTSDQPGSDDKKLSLDDREQEEWDAEARALHEAVAEGAIFTDNVDFLEKNSEKCDKEEEDVRGQPSSSVSNSKALHLKTIELLSVQKKLPWMETLDVMPEDPLPFESAKDVHDDLKREVAFYNVALEAVQDAKFKFQQNDVPFSRPDDFFAEMMKTDRHMTKVKDRLIFESKKISAFEQRKNNQEFKLRAKESQAKKLEAKSRQKKENIEAVQEWAKNAASSRHGVVDDDNKEYVKRFGQPNKKRMIADRKYGFGGKRGRFKQEDKKSLNDYSSFNPRGNFGGLGSKKTGGPASGGKRMGKRAREAARQRK